jgi:23S rRNA (guanosine2251-2'-O)-methyltransferase
VKLKLEKELVCGINAVSQIIKTRPSSVHSLYINSSNNERLNALVRDATENKIEIFNERLSFFEDNFEGVNHQNAAIICNKRSEESEQFLDPILNKDEVKILILEGLTDPHNVGACLRSAAGVDIDAVIVPKNRSCHLTPTVRKISCGASELIPFVVVTNIVRTINKLQEKGISVYGSDLQANQSYENVNYSSKYALVIGSEDKGIRRLTRENCDDLIKIDMSEKMDSLNASVSTGILLFEISRQIKLTETNIVK